MNVSPVKGPTVWVPTKSKVQGKCRSDVRGQCNRAPNVNEVTTEVTVQIQRFSGAGANVMGKAVRGNKCPDV